MSGWAKMNLDIHMCKRRTKASKNKARISCDNNEGKVICGQGNND